MSKLGQGDEIECMICNEGVLQELGSKWENACGEDDSYYFVCNKCGSLYNESGQLIREGSEDKAKKRMTDFVERMTTEV